LAGELFHRFLEHGEELEVVSSTDFKVVGAGTSDWRRPGAAELAEWQAMFDAIEDASGRLTVLELGAGIGRWIVNSAVAIRQYRPELRYRLIGLEAEPSHYRWMKQHARNNGLRRWSRAGSCKLIEAAVSREAGRERFYFGNAMDWYGQALVRPENEGADTPVTEVRTMTLSGLLAPLDRVDLIDLDIQGAELEVLTEAAPVLGRVRRMHVETHSDEIDEKLPEILQQAAGDWHQEIAIRLGAQQSTPLGEADFKGGGAQVWRNNRL
jgi:FkbM family methyltransferase